MKRLYSLAWAFAIPACLLAQATGVSIETVMVHDGSIDASLDGYTTYRIYADVSAEFDFVSSVFGDATNPLMLGCDGTIYQSATSTNPAVDYNYGNAVNAAFFPVFPTTQYDSWLTIGTDDATQGVNVQSTDATMAPALALFNAGEGFVINNPFGATWFNVYPCAGAPDLAACAGTNPAFGGADNKVLLAQITADGDVYGLFNVQVFPNGVQSAQVQSLGLTFSTDDSDVFGCTNEAATNYDPTATVDDFSCTLPCVVSLQVNNVQTPSCNGENDALIQVSATGAQGADYFYNGSLSATAQNFGNFPNLVAGTYTIYVVDGAGCVDSLDVEVPVTEVVTVNAALTSAVTCNNANNAVLTVTSTTGGSGEYEYYISNNPTVLTTQTEWTNLAGGQTLTVYAMDSNGCMGNSTPVQITNPTPVVVTLAPANTVDASCYNVADGSIYLVSYGGTAPSTIQYSVDGQNFGPSPLTVSGGSYTVTAQDINGCTGTVANPVVIGPDPILVNATATPEACFGENNGEVTWSPAGGAGGFMVSFEGEENTAGSVGDLAPGQYAVTVTDMDGCVETQTVDVLAGVEIVISSEVLDATCNGENDGEVTVSATGGTGAFQYSDDGNNFAGNPVFDDLLAGSYTFFVQDENGCVQDVTAEVGEPEAIVVTGIVSEGSSTGEGSIDITVTGGSLPYTYEWIGPGVSGTDTQDLDNISTGIYTVEVTDANGCSTTQSFNLTTDVSELFGGMEARVFPNPSNGDFNLVLEGAYTGVLDFHVVDAQGRIVNQGQWQVQAGQFATTLELTSFESGLYRLVMVSEHGMTTLQLVKSH